MKMSKEKIWLSSPTMHGEEQEFVKDAFDTNWVAPLGPHVNELEKEVCEYLRAGHAAALSAGTAALHLAIRMLGIGEGDIVLCQDLTFAASCNPVTYEKAVPVFVDSETETWNMSPEALRKALRKYPEAKAVVAVDLYGTPAKLEEITQICREHGIPLIEDAAEALGSTLNGKACGTFGRINALSFNGNKIITTSGGGMLISEEEELVQKARFLATQARDPAPWYEHTSIGFNYRMSNICAAIGRGQMLHIREHVRKKQEIYRTYCEAFKGMKGISMNPMNPEGEANNWLSCLVLGEDCRITPLELQKILEAENIETRPIWKPMHMQPVYSACDFISAEEGEPVSEQIFAHGLCLPSDIKNTEEDMQRIISIIREYV